MGHEPPFRIDHGDILLRTDQKLADGSRLGVHEVECSLQIWYHQTPQLQNVEEFAPSILCYDIVICDLTYLDVLYSSTWLLVPDGPILEQSCKASRGTFW